MTITKLQLKAIRDDMNAALDAVRVKHDLQSLSCAKCVYFADNFTMKVEGIVAGGLSRDAKLYNESRFLGLPPLGFAFTSKGEKFVTTGLNTTGTKVYCKRESDGKTYLYPADYIVRLGKSSTLVAKALASDPRVTS